MKEHPKVTVRVNISGTGGGFKRFKDGDLDICDASRPIEKNELEACQKNNVSFVELKIGIDGISVVVNPQNTWCKSLTVEQLKKLWQAGSKLKTWNELDPSFPNQKIILYGPDTDSGTFDYFTEVICGKRGNSRTDYTPNSNDNVLIQGVQGDAGALGYFGYAYYILNKETIRALPIAAKDGAPVAPTDETILERPIQAALPPLVPLREQKGSRPARSGRLCEVLPGPRSRARERGALHPAPCEGIRRKSSAVQSGDQRVTSRIAS